MSQQIDIKQLSRLQKIIKSKVDEYLKSRERESLRYTKVSINVENNVPKLHIKIYLDKPMNLNAINDLVSIVSSIVKTSDWKIYAPHTHSIRLSCLIEFK